MSNRFSHHAANNEARSKSDFYAPKSYTNMISALAVTIHIRLCALRALAFAVAQSGEPPPAATMRRTELGTLD